MISNLKLEFVIFRSHSYRSCLSNGILSLRYERSTSPN